jgi:hypothetical protein
MPIIKGAMGYQRYRISEASLSPEEVAKKLVLFKFRPLHAKGFDQESAGWCAYLAEYDHEKQIEIKDILFDEKIVLTMRFDCIALPKPLLKANIKKSLGAYYQEYKKWPDRVVKKEIEQAETMALRERILPKTRIVEAIWHLKSGELRIFTRASSLVDRFLDLFQATFLQRPSHRDFVFEAFHVAAKTGVGTKLEHLAHLPIFTSLQRSDVN